MKTPNLIIRIPEPCHEDWNKMQPDDKGKFCGSCSKSVFDFSNKTDTEIRDILIQYKDQKVCGHFKKTQIDRPLNIRINLKDLPRNVSSTKAFAIALFVVFGTLLFSCTNQQNQKIGEIEIEKVITETKPEEMLVGVMMVPPDQLMKGDTVMEDSLANNITCGENYVDGGIMVEEVHMKGEVEPMIEDTLKGQTIVMSIPKDTVITKKTSVVSLSKDTTAVRTFTSTVTESTVSVKETILDITVAHFNVYPNPSNGEFIIKYDILKRSDVRIDIFDIKGALLSTPVNTAAQYEGKYQVPVNLQELPNGIYFVNLTNNGKKSSAKLIIEK